LTIANRITLLRIIFIPLNVWLILLGINGLAALLFLLLSATDAIDGYVARRFGQVSELGKFLDPLADKILVITALIGLVSQGSASPVAVMVLTAREFLVSGIRVSAAKAGNILPASPLAKWKTIAQIIAVLMLILNLPLANVILWLAVVLALVSGGEYLWQNLKHLKQT
jgi:CDP-diacylglycerol--glycerol-3-phosphate 3-phosphatidyltransferase